MVYTKDYLFHHLIVNDTSQADKKWPVKARNLIIREDQFLNRLTSIIRVQPGN